MRKIKIIFIAVLMLGIIAGTTSCVVVLKREPGTKRGWTKNTNNPHHPYSTNPGKAKNKHRGK